MIQNNSMQTPLVSVIIPNYCHAKYLDQRIQSVLNQTYRNFEVIILDDCSPDDGASRAVIEKYRDNPHVSHIVYNTENSGSTFRQWNKGFGLAKGELIWIAESDDYCEKELLAKLVQPFINNQDTVISFCRSIAFNDHGIIGPVGKDIQEGFISGSAFIHDYMRAGNGIINASSAVFRKKTLTKIRKDYQTYSGAGDRLFWIYLAEQGDVCYLEKGLNYFRTHLANTTSKKNLDGTNQREDKKILDYIYTKGYISAKEYSECSWEYVRVHIFEMLTDKTLKKQLYKVWGIGTFGKIKLRLEAWMKKKNTMLCR